MAEPDTSRFVSEQWLPFPVEDVFLFFADPRNLPRLMPTWQAARIDDMALVEPAPSAEGDARGVPLAGSGSRVTLSFRPFPHAPFRLRWEAVIKDFAWNSHFADVQLSGPFAYWRHRHSIRSEQRDGQLGSLLRDEVHYAAPFGALGRLAGRMIFPLELRSTFAYRHRMALKLLSNK